MLDYREDNLINEKSFGFAVIVIDVCKFQIRTGTSIGANIEETQEDFLSKMSTVSKKDRQTLYWIKLLVKSNF